MKRSLIKLTQVIFILACSSAIKCPSSISKKRKLKTQSRSVDWKITSHPGYITINTTNDTNKDKKFKSKIFYWYFPSPVNHSSKETPLCFWLQGGPGVSSISAVFEECGPYRLKKGKLMLNPYSWHHFCDMVFIDQPIGTGFSTAPQTNFAKSLQEVTSQFRDFYIGFMKKHKKLSKKKLYLTGESYAGRYIPHIAMDMLSSPKLYTKNGSIGLAGVLIGDPSIAMFYHKNTL